MNLLFILADQHRHDAIAAAGCSWIRTPNLDHLCTGGVRFTHCHSPAPMCVPARAALLSGRHPHETGVYGNSDCLDDSRFPTFSARLAEGHIAVEAIGRTHHMTHGCRFTRVLPGKSWPAEYGGPYGGRTLGKSPVDLDEYWDVRIARAGLRRLSEAMQTGQPTVSFVNLQMPHPPFTLPEPYYSRAEELARQMDPPRPPKGYFESHPVHHRSFWERQLEHISDDHLCRMKAYYYVSCEVADYAVGMLLDGLEELGIGETTPVIYSSDHGDLAGDHGLFSKGATMFDGEARVPLICRWPGRVPAGATCDHLVSLLDIGPSLLDAYGLPAEESFVGQSLWASACSEAPERGYITSVSGSPGGRHFAHMIRDRDWKLVEHTGDVGELYDLATDPGETVNRFGDPVAAPAQQRLREALLRHLVNTSAPSMRFDDATRTEQISELERDMETLESGGHDQTFALGQADARDIVRE
ncbi:sulfatase-like hydrolase/transferase [Candidatus Latescibacterota bacterium]